MSEQLLSSEIYSLDVEQKHHKEQYRDLDKTRLICEEDGRYVYDHLRKLSDIPSEDRTESNKSDFNKYKAFFELDESILSDVERSMASTEIALGYGPERSNRYDDDKNDVLVNSSIFYHDRIDSLRKATGNPDVDETFVNTIIEYAKAVEHDSYSVMHVRYENDIQIKQEYMKSCQRRRSMQHNELIKRLNELNDLARKHDQKPLTYRNLVTNFASNRYRNDDQMNHDRVSLVHYVGRMINSGHDDRMPDSKHIK